MPWTEAKELTYHLSELMQDACEVNIPNSLRAEIEEMVGNSLDLVKTDAYANAARRVRAIQIPRDVSPEAVLAFLDLALAGVTQTLEELAFGVTV